MSDMIICISECLYSVGNVVRAQSDFVNGNITPHVQRLATAKNSNTELQLLAHFVLYYTLFQTNTSCNPPGRGVTRVYEWLTVYKGRVKFQESFGLRLIKLHATAAKTSSTTRHFKLLNDSKYKNETVKIPAKTRK